MIICGVIDCYCRSSNQSTKAVKLPVTPSTATLTKTQKNKTKNKKKPVEKKAAKQSASPAKNASPPAPSSSQVSWHITLEIHVHDCTIEGFFLHASWISFGINLFLPIFAMFLRKMYAKKICFIDSEILVHHFTEFHY